MFDSCHLAQRCPSSIDAVKTASLTNPSQFDVVEMTQNPAYGPVAATAVKKDTQYEEETQYEEVALSTCGWNN